MPPEVSVFSTHTTTALSIHIWTHTHTQKSTHLRAQYWLHQRCSFLWTLGFFAWTLWVLRRIIRRAREYRYYACKSVSSSKVTSVGIATVLHSLYRSGVSILCNKCHGVYVTFYVIIRKYLIQNWKLLDTYAGLILDKNIWGIYVNFTLIFKKIKKVFKTSRTSSVTKSYT